MKNKELRKAIIEDGTLKTYTATRRQYNDDCRLEEFEMNAPEILGLSSEILHECENARNCRTKQRNNIEEHIRYLVNQNYDLYFGTWTIDPAHYELSQPTQKKALTRALANAEDYIINVDYGKTTGRKHFHGVVALRPGTYKITAKKKVKGRWRYKIDLLNGYTLGNYDLEEIDTTDKDIDAISGYITKLTQHSIKVQQSYVSAKKGTEYQREKNRRKVYGKDLTAYETAQRIRKEYM